MHSCYVLNVVMLHTCKREMFAFLAILPKNVPTDMPTCIQRYLRAFVSIRILTASVFFIRNVIFTTVRCSGMSVFHRHCH